MDLNDVTTTAFLVFLACFTIVHTESCVKAERDHTYRMKQLEIQKECKQVN